MSNSDSQPRPEREPDSGHLSFDKERQAAWTPPEAYPQPPRPQQPAPHISGAYYPTPPSPAAAPYQPYGYDQRPPHERTSGLALAGFITALGSLLMTLTFFFAFLGFFGAIAALVLSIIGMVGDVKARGMKGHGFALAGIIIAAVTLAVIVLGFIALIVIGIASSGDTSSCPSGDYCPMQSTPYPSAGSI